MIKLSEISTVPAESLNKKDCEKLAKRNSKLIAKKVEYLSAQKKHSLLVIFQGMDAAGKDGAVEKVFGDCSAIGLRQYSFKKPTEEEFAHDFLWRVHSKMPAKGEVVLFNRSHYEDILIQRVHNWIDDEKVKLRMNAINSFEELISFDNNTTILKFYLHISYDEQEKQLLERVNIPNKRFKHNNGDWAERLHWEEYMKAYEYAINNSKIPWYIIPVDMRWYRDYLISTIILEKLNQLDINYPKLPKPENYKIL